MPIDRQDSCHRYQIVNEYLMAFKYTLILNFKTSSRSQKIENHYGIKWEKIV